MKLTFDKISKSYGKTKALTENARPAAPNLEDCYLHIFGEAAGT